MRLSRRDIIQEDCCEAIHHSLSLLKPIKDETLLITGGTGFMGTWLSEMVAFLNDNHDFGTKLFLLSNNATNFKIQSAHIALRDDVTIIEQDIRGLIDISNDINWIIHAAASPDNRIHTSDPIKTIEVIVDGTRSILEYATRLPELKKILNISSGQVYGNQPCKFDNLSENQFVNFDPSSLGSVYPEAKRLAETICTAYRTQHRLPIVNSRPFAFIGPYQHLDRPWAINNFIRDCLRGGPIRILGDGETVRSYMYPSDMALWILTILIKGTNGSNYNIGSPQGVTLKELAEIIASKFPKQSEIILNFSNNKNFKTTKFVPDISHAKKLGLNIKISLDEAIERTIMWNQL